MDQTTGDVASQLFAAVLDFWSLLLQQESWALVSQPVSSSYETANQGDGSSPQDVDMDSDPYLSSEPDRGWNLERFLLNEERDRLCLWKFNFTDEDLNRLIGNRSSVFGGAVVQCLVNIGQALINEADIQNCTTSVHELKNSRNVLESLISDGRSLIRQAYYDDDMAETLASTYEPSVMTEFTVPDDKAGELHDVLKSDIGKLQRLSFSISETLAGMVDQ